MITAEQVRAAMREHELSQSQVACMNKVSQPVISQWLSGGREPSEVSRTRIALALDLIGPGESDDAAIGEALNADAEAEALARSASDDVTLYDSDEAAAAAEIMAALSMHDDPDPP